MPKRKYDKADRIFALKIYDLCEGNLSAASRETKIPRMTLAKWVKERTDESRVTDYLSDDEPLTDKQRKFIDARVSGKNQTQAAREAGYSGNDDVLARRGHELARNSKIQERIARRVISAASLTADEVIGTLAEHMRGDVDDLLNEPGYVSLDAARERGVTHLIKKIKYGEFGIAEVEFHSPQIAAVQLSKILGIEQEPAKNRGDLVKRMLKKLMAQGVTARQAADDLVKMAVNEDDVKAALNQIEAHEAVTV